MLSSGDTASAGEPVVPRRSRTVWFSAERVMRRRRLRPMRVVPSWMQDVSLTIPPVPPGVPALPDVPVPEAPPVGLPAVVPPAPDVALPPVDVGLPPGPGPSTFAWHPRASPEASKSVWNLVGFDPVLIARALNGPGRLGSVGRESAKQSKTPHPAVLV